MSSNGKSYTRTRPSARSVKITKKLDNLPKNREQTPEDNSPKLKIIPLGGLHEIGKNTCVFEYEDEIIILDAGLAFPTDGMHGVNIVLPDVTYLRDNRDKIKGMIVTHGHEDHIGGIAFHLKQFDIPVIYGPRLAMALLHGKLEEAGVSDRTELRTVRPRDIVRIGKNFLVEYIRNTHSIADSFTVAINTPVGVVIHTGDFKVDHTPVDGEFFDFQRLAEYGEKGVHCLLSDSTNAEVPGFTPSEASVYPNLERIMATASGRVLVTTFASSVHRVNIILSIAQKLGRSVAVVGRSMLNVIAHSRNLGYIKCPDNLFIPLNAIRSLPDEKVLILTTGSQGEPLAAMTRIANGAHRQISIKQGDTIIFSANPIPGNTIAVVNTIDKLMMQGANVVYGRHHGIHVSGHGCQEDHKLMLALTRPKFFVPVHGEHRMLVQHSKTAQSMGIPRENMVIINNGDVVELTENSIRVGGKVPSGIEPVDSSRTGFVRDDVLKERQQLAEDGLITVAVAVSDEGKLLAIPETHLKGVVMTADQATFKQQIVKVIEATLSDRWSELSRSFGNGEGNQIDWVGVRTEIERAIARLLRRELQSNPLLVVLMQTPEESPDSTASSTTETPQPATGRRRPRTAARVAS
ncbi:MAG: ribonuclease J [Limnospira sp. PMC 1286.21]|uniref:Ribonuclease J n=2 Tax=Limnospira TaxID=2596745 RepID=A0ABU9EST7_LIMFS|nr:MULTISPECIES: ribonuclease J [Limnospira]MDC0840092.1 ribonuclease J [Limnoraphis robusta]MDY7054483.1 ribonuclease J [Limnospira fusiformis LS22]QJB24915.1 ribonuclease J [Limnospira fusiformis SAG 85.79]UWU46541.1 ribonuclease J [Arthrospira platensis C1]MDT9178789.1 ribonuclease J [Limnospira sp. PMC 1238.20]